MAFRDVPGFARVASLEDIRAKDADLSIPLYVSSAPKVEQEQAGYEVNGLEKALSGWLESSRRTRKALRELFDGNGASK